MIGRFAVIVALALLLAFAWRAVGLWLAFAALALLALALFLNRRFDPINRRLAALGARMRAEAQHPHAFTLLGLSLLGTLVIVNLGAISDFIGDQLDRASVAEEAFTQKLLWLEETASDAEASLAPGAKEAFEAAHDRYALSATHGSRQPSPSVGVEELIERRFSLGARELTITGDIVKVESFPNDVVGLWLWDTDEHRRAEAICAVRDDEPEAFSEGQRTRLEAMPLLYGSKGRGGDSRGTVGLACARADIVEFRDWSPEEQVDSYIDAMQNREGWDGAMDASRDYWIDHFEDFRLDHARPFDEDGTRRVRVRRLVWGSDRFDGRLVLTWGWVTSASEVIERLRGRRFVRQTLGVRESVDSNTEATCELLRPADRSIREGEWVYLVGVPIGTSAPRTTDGGFLNAVHMACSSVYVYR